MKKNSKKISKIIAPLALASGCLATVPATSCGTAMFSDVKHIAPYLHEITYNDYREDTDYETIKEAEAFGCSSVRNGNFYGRNFDYIYNDTPEFIVHVKADQEKKRHASLAVATHFGLREDKLLKGKYHKQLELIPNLTMDGINDAGVICSSNVVSLEPQSKNIKPETNPDNPNAKNVHMLFLVRFVLDNASSVQDAITKLSSPDINIMGNLNNKNFLHVMIADKNSTAIVEFYHKQESTHNHFDVVGRIIDTTKEKPIMTNFYRNLDTVPSDFNNDEKSGYERWKILENYYSLSNSFVGMQALLKKVQFSQAYEYGHNPVFTDNKSTDGISGDLNSEWYSEKWSFDELSKAEKTYAQWQEYIKEIKLDELKDAYREARNKEDRATANPAFWHTTHNSTYDLENAHLQIIVQEEYAKQYDFYLNEK